VSIDVRACSSAEELRQALVIWHYFGGEPTLDEATRFSAVLPPERMHGAWDGETCVGGAGAFPFRISLPGGRSAPSAGVTVVGVAPTHRRKGVLTALMRAQLDDVRRRGEPIAWLWASEATIYGRYGYGLASFAADVSLPRERTAFAVDRPLVGRPRLVAHEEAIETIPGVYERVAAQQIGMPSRDRAWWEARRLNDLPQRRGGAGVLNRMILEEGGEAVGYALYRVKQVLEHHVTTGSLVVVEAMGVTPEATRAVWRFLLDIDWVARIEASNLSVDHPLFLLLAEPRRAQMRVADGVWARLVDVGAALSARGYASGERVIFEVTDGFCPWNAGRWLLQDGVARRTEDPADLRLPVDALGSAYLGGFTFRRLWEAGRVEELREGALATADRIFATDRAPWCPEVF
jgi:predicted acetyltransferase